jgi:AcrR family transcriptional regulator
MTPTEPTPSPADLGLRADAARNRARILDAARDVFAEHGLDASMNEVARRAGVGVATLFRRFATREDLIAATFADRMSEYAAAIETALENPDPWDGFSEYMRHVCAMQAGDRGFTDVMTQSFPTAKTLEAERAQTFRRFSELVDRAKEAGRLRADFVAEDFPMLMMANAGVVTATGSTAPETSPRLVEYLLQAFGAANAQPLPPPPTPRRMLRALTRLQRKVVVGVTNVEPPLRPAGRTHLPRRGTHA